MIRGRLKLVQFLISLTLLFLPLISFVIAGYLRFGTHLLPFYTIQADPSAYFGLLLLTTIIWAIMTEKYNINSIEAYLLPEGRIRRTALSWFATYLAVLAITFFYRETTFSRLFMWVSGLSLLALALAFQVVVRWIWRKKRAWENAGASVLIVGADEFAVRVADSLRLGPAAHCRIKGHIRLPNQESVVNSGPVYELSDVHGLAVGNGFDDVIIAIPPALIPELPSLRVQLAPLCVPTRLVLDVVQGSHTHQRLFSLGDLLLVDLESTPAESMLYVILKRAFDIIFSTCFLIISAPLFLLIAIAVRLSSPGPVVFVQERVGLNGKLFRMYKFRSMKVPEVPVAYSEWTTKEDPRRTGVGAFLRKTSLDELPQFFNVLKGDMSVVGPRPEGPILVQKFMQSVGNYNTRHHLKVGITGWAQVNGWRGDTSIEKRVEYDLYYIRHWTFAFDLFIVFLTFVRGFTDKNAY
jgi:Undecaprenyl-phosphate glucose phosphotransferase